MENGNTTTPSPFSAPIHGKPLSNISILLINPNSSPSMTAGCLDTIRASLPQNCTVTGFTAPRPGPSAIESITDAILSAEACIRALAADKQTSQMFDAMLVACFSAHPLIPALREMYSCPVVGIMESALYASRMLGGRFGIVSTSMRAQTMQGDGVAGYGLSQFYAGSEATKLGVLELETQPKKVVLGKVGEAARVLVEERGADCVALGCAGMTDMVRAAEEAVGANDEGRGRVNVIDGVEIGVHFLIALVRARLGTAKRGMYISTDDARIARGQDWI